MNIAVIGSGNVGTALGEGFAAKGHNVVYGARDPKKEAGGRSTLSRAQSRVAKLCCWLFHGIRSNLWLEETMSRAKS
jgi:predicted dinucleotide-binding enzyme